MDEYLPPLYAFTIYSFMINYLLPVSLICILYVKILLRLFRLKRQHCFAYSSRTKKRTHKRITKMVLAIIVCYMVSWTPYWFVQLFHYVYQHLFNRTNSLVLAIISHSAQVIAYFSSALNPLIYSYMNESFRNELNDSLRCLSWCKRRKHTLNRTVNNNLNGDDLVETNLNQNSQVNNNDRAGVVTDDSNSHFLQDFDSTMNNVANTSSIFLHTFTASPQMGSSLASFCDLVNTNSNNKKQRPRVSFATELNSPNQLLDSQL
jgi:hypothetical protein